MQTSTFESGNQWDATFGWAPLQMVAVEGLRRYGFNDDADRISRKWLSLVKREFLRTGIIVEKYDVLHPGMDVSCGIGFGYGSNEAGFGWTNAVYTRLLDELPAEKKVELGWIRSRGVREPRSQGVEESGSGTPVDQRLSYLVFK